MFEGFRDVFSLAFFCQPHNSCRGSVWKTPIENKTDISVPGQRTGIMEGCNYSLLLHGCVECLGRVEHADK